MLVYVYERVDVSIMVTCNNNGIERDMIEEEQSCKSNAPFHTKQHTLHQYRENRPANLNLFNRTYLHLLLR